MIIITSVWIRASAEPETEENWGTCTAANGDQGICQDTSTCQGISTRFLWLVRSFVSTTFSSVLVVLALRTFNAVQSRTTQPIHLLVAIIAHGETV